MSVPGFTRSDLCSIRTAGEQEELAVSVCEESSAYGCPLRDDDAPAPLTSGVDRAIRLSTAAAVLAVAGIAAYVSYWHAYAVVRAHGETGITARLEPATIDGLVYASSMVVLYAARHRMPVPSLARWLLGLGIAATLTANMAQGWSHGLVGAVVAAWPAVSLVGSYELLVWLIRTSGAVERGRSAENLCNRAACRAPIRIFPTSAVDGDRHGVTERRTSGSTRRPRLRPPGCRLSQPTSSVATRYLKPAPSMTRQWPRTGSACRLAIRFPNADWLRCSGARPAAGHERESLTHDKHHRPKTRRAPRSLLNWRRRRANPKP
jgi:hypothetical protein